MAKTDFTVELGGITFHGELTVNSEDDIAITECYVKRPIPGSFRRDDVEVDKWAYNGMDLEERLIEELADQIDEILEEDGSEDDESDD